MFVNRTPDTHTHSSGNAGFHWLFSQASWVDLPTESRIPASSEEICNTTVLCRTVPAFARSKCRLFWIRHKDQSKSNEVPDLLLSFSVA